MKLYLLPGMGGDERLFANFKIAGTDKVVLNWKEPQGQKTLATYARFMAEDIDASQPFILAGCSMGGMLAVEISKFLKPEKLILISAAKTRSELPLQIRMWRWFPIYHIVPAGWFLFFAGRTASRMGLKDKTGRLLFRDMLEVNGKAYLKKAIRLVVTWKNDELPQSYIHVHGTSDKVLPFRNVKGEVIRIQNGSHFMVLIKGGEMSELLGRQDYIRLEKDTSNSHGQSLPVT